MAEARRYSDLRVVFTDAADSSTRQIQDVHNLLDSGIDLLIISPNDSEALSPVIAEAYKKIPVILLDRSVIGFDYTLFIGPDNRLIGKQAGQYVSELLGAKGGKVVEILGRSGSPPVLDRSIGFQEAIAPHPQIRVVGTLVADWLRDKAEDEMAAWLRKNGRVDVVFAQNDAMADGAQRAAQKLGITGIDVVGIDGLPGPDGGIELVKDGVLSATFTCPTGGKEAVIYAMDILHHEEGIPKKMILRTSLVTQQTIERGVLGAALARRGCRPIIGSCWGSPRPARRATGAWRTPNRSRPRRGRPGSTWSSSTREGQPDEADRRGAVLHRAQGRHHRLFSDRRVRVGARAPGGKGGRDPGLHHGPRRGREGRVALGDLHGLRLRGGGAAGRAVAGRLHEDRQAGEHRGAAGDDRLRPRDRPHIGVQGDPQGPSQLPHHRLRGRRLRPQRRQGGHAADPQGPRGQRPEDGRALCAQRRHGHRRHRGHEGRGHPARARTSSSSPWTASAMRSPP